MIIGPMASGKTSAANHLVEKFGFKCISLAGPIKDMESKIDNAVGIADFTDIIFPHFSGIREFGDSHISKMVKVLQEAKEIEREEPKPRKRLQFIGTEGGRQRIHPDIWIKILRNTINKSPSNTQWVIDDVRFINEFNSLNDLFLPIKLTVSKKVQLQRLRNLYPNFDGSVLRHSSELDFYKMEVGRKYIVNANVPLERMNLDIETKLGLK